MRIALVNVQYHEGNNVFPPLGVLYVAAALRAEGHALLVLDEDPALRPDLAARVADFRPDVVGLSFLTMTWDRARDLAAAIRTRLPGAFLVAGGAHPTADPEGTLEDLAVDAVAVGEGEATAVELARAVERGGTVDGIPGLVTRRGAGPPRDAVADLDALPFPARDLLGHEPYLRPPGLIRGYASARIASMLASRGCPFRCAYCGSHRQLGRKVRMRSVGNVMAELEELVARDGILGMYWVDDVFTHDRDWVLAFCDALRARPWRLEWGCQSRATAVDEALLRAMKAAGCVQVDVGVESGSARVLRAMHKGVTPDQVVAAFDLLHAVGLRTGASFILGYPGETAEDLAETERLAARIRSDWTVFFYSTPYPGTDLWKKARAHAAEWPDYGQAWNNRVGPSPFEQGALPADFLVRARERLQNRHFRRNYLRARNVPFILRLARTLPEPEVRRVAGRLLVRGGRVDDLVEAAFSAWRTRAA